MTVNKASIATLPLPVRRRRQHVLRLCAVHQLPARQLQLRRQHRASAERPAAGRPAQHGGNLPPLTGIISMSKMYLGQGACAQRAYAATTNVNVTLASITDGTSNTAAVSESLVNDGSGN